MDFPLLAEWSLFCERGRFEQVVLLVWVFVCLAFFNMTVLNVGATKGMLDKNK